MLLIDEYTSYLESTEGKTKGTIEQYYNSIKIWMQYMKENKFSVNKNTISTVKVPDIYGFLASLMNTNANSSRRNKVSALKSFFEYCKDVELIKHNIILDIKKLPKSDKKIPTYFSIEDCKKLFSSVDSRNKERDKMILQVLVVTGLRLSELCNLNVDCIDSSSPKVLGKRNKERAIYFPPELVILLKEYLKIRPKVDDNALFLNERKMRIGNSAVQNLCKNAIERAGLNPEHKKDILVHVFRHTAASIMINDGVDIRKIQEILGHEDISTTMIYTHIAKKQLQDVTNNSSLRLIL